MASTSAGTMLSLSYGAPTTDDAADYAALTYTEVGGVESIAAFGATSGVNSFQPLKGGQEKHKGAATFGALQIPMAIDKADAGQALMRNLAEPDNNTLASFRVRFPNGDKRYFRGRVFGMPEVAGGAASVLMAMAAVEISTRIVKADLIAVFGLNQPSWGGTLPLFGD